MNKNYYLKLINKELKNWLLQRITAFIFIIYNIIFIIFLLFKKNNYENIKNLFSTPWFKKLTIFAFIILCYHIVIGVNDVCKDYIKNYKIRKITKFFIKLFISLNVVWIIKILYIT